MIRRKLKKIARMDKYRGKTLTTKNIIRVVKDEFNRRIGKTSINASLRKMKKWADKGCYDFNLRKEHRAIHKGGDRWLVEIEE